MFQLELLELLKKFKKADEYEKEKLKSSIRSLIKENQEKYDEFINNTQLGGESKSILDESLATQEPVEETEQNDDILIIKKYYETWLKTYKKNKNQISKENEQVITSLINFYIINRFEVLEKILDLKDTLDYENFKNHLKNSLRAYFAKLIEKYLASDNYESLNFFSKRRKKNEVLNILNDIGEYKFNKAKIKEITQ